MQILWCTDVFALTNFLQQFDVTTSSTEPSTSPSRCEAAKSAPAEGSEEPGAWLSNSAWLLIDLHLCFDWFRFIRSYAAERSSGEILPEQESRASSVFGYSMCFEKWACG